MATYLSPLAPAFNPSMGFDEYDICIYNEGKPSLYPADVHSESDILSGISDEALDEYFPPSAKEAAEIEAAEVFVFTMARLDMLEEMEEHTREDLAHGRLPMRWEARRQQGLVGKPRPATTIVPTDADKHSAHDKTSYKSAAHETKIVSHTHRHRDLALMEYVSRQRTRAELGRRPTKIPKQKRPQSRSMIIHQYPSKLV